jgi:putative transposase
MPRTARAIVANYCYHVLNRSNDRKDVFREPSDYAAFLSLLRDAQERLSLPVLAACLMPNHLHLVVQPLHDNDISQWTHWLFTTHAAHHHRKYKSTGRIWQGRFKAFVIQQDDHLLTVLRYVERNAMRSELVDRAEHWPWGSLRWRAQVSPPVELAVAPVPLPVKWIEYVNEPLTATELAAVRKSVNRQRPFGSCDWAQRTATDLSMTFSLRPAGRPRRTAVQSDDLWK